eukprot:m.479596 g.479596  ORF g.479596 m.479596 type:complete len:71 (+) comp21511_c0_seq1:667-879(+)
MATDSQLSTFHRNAHLVDIVDQEWQADKLEPDHISVPPQHEVSVDELEDGSELPKDAENKWTELGVGTLQ